MLEIVYQDAYMVAVNKPHGLLVHRSPIAADAEEFALQMLRDQLQKRVYPIHRIDRKTSGILLFALSSEMAGKLQKALEEEETQKTYLAIVRGYFPDEIRVDYPLTNDRGKKQEALTVFKVLQRSELDISLGQFSTSRYSLIHAFPKTGRMHQIRKHLDHLRHPIIGDRPHGCNKQNRLFKERWGMTTMMLHAMELQLRHPVSGELLHIRARLFKTFEEMIKTLKFDE
ncbi:pseudouridine synthase [Saccharicrinis fermentans]|uniref:tRNA pseudouridine synthase C n=1 Tax=Saccharicrinis fermentans DSM 9555 = JCM 21142 TaxID=869213 RepID=W7YKW9_9BACT|nr:pseudouridine synthase [Saccharicrinis fermentans]GAF03004.1 tRNA pseudouridine synthase C [Saccharicrinis fermentans DSM 9555 = JCM 21142]